MLKLTRAAGGSAPRKKHSREVPDYKVPDDIAVTGFDNIPDSDFTFPPLATVHAPKMLLGKLAAERLAQRIENPNDVHLRIATPTSLVVRQSCGSRKSDA